MDRTGNLEIPYNRRGAVLAGALNQLLPRHYVMSTSCSVTEPYITEELIALVIAALLFSLSNASSNLFTGIHSPIKLDPFTLGSFECRRQRYRLPGS
jgi:hypothetical protein